MCFTSYHENKELSFHHYFYMHVYHIHIVNHLCVIQCIIRTQSWPTTKANEKKECQNPPERTKNYTSILRFYTSSQHQHIWHFNASLQFLFSLLLFLMPFRFIGIYSISLGNCALCQCHTHAYKQKMIEESLAKVFIMVFFFNVVNRLSIISTCKWISFIWNKK